MDMSRSRHGGISLLIGIVVLALALIMVPAASDALASTPAGSSGKQAGLAGKAAPHQAARLQASAPAGEVTISGPARPDIVLYDQYDNPGGSGINSQNY